LFPGFVTIIKNYYVYVKAKFEYLNPLSANVGILYMRVSHVAIVAPRTGKIIKNGLHVFERGEKLL